jgi:membrane protein CcdC involved in cytochrome C biogenesis
MTANAVFNIVLIAAAVVWILWKQIQPAPIKARLLLLAPLAMGYFGIRNTPGSTWSSAADLTLILIGAIFAIVLGLARGGTIQVWRERDGQLWRRGSKMTLFLWAALLVVRVMMAGLATATGHRAADASGPILLSLALSFAAQNAVTGLRMSALANGTE